MPTSFACELIGNETPSKKTKPETPNKKLVNSATGGKRFVIDDSDSEEKQIDMKTEAGVTALEKAYYERELEQAQGKLVLLAAALHGTWTLLGAYSERMVEWSAVYRKWAKGADDANVAEFQKCMDALSDNRDLNNALLLKANAIFNEISDAIPALERITLDDETFNEWRSAMPKGFEKLIEKEGATLISTSLG